MENGVFEIFEPIGVSDWELGTKTLLTSFFKMHWILMKISETMWERMELYTFSSQLSRWEGDRSEKRHQKVILREFRANSSTCYSSSDSIFHESW